MKFKIGDRIRGIGEFHELNGEIARLYESGDYDVHWSTHSNPQGQTKDFVERYFTLDEVFLVEKLLKEYELEERRLR
jgi:hypothetical protein